ncbi:hypothetical protein [Arthrobacter sp. BE255]|uniref:hypothetical protein n=1 Tax=Arthrobacter sp. BE255 TaxID=2817721 RepID=UPI00285DA721|nr:hypothetical protein [Arthrobacter sp. BE255]MDR7160481.1 hypothetical protein [Arthrobacter sp. BE255]
MAKFRGLHVVAGIAAMLVAAMLGSAMRLNNTAVVMSSCVVFVAVAMWADSAISKRRREASSLSETLTLQQAASLDQATSLEPGHEAAPASRQDIPQRGTQDQSLAPGEPSKHEGNAA